LSTDLVERRSGWEHDELPIVGSVTNALRLADAVELYKQETDSFAN
jgi:hypothetical protein